MLDLNVWFDDLQEEWKLNIYPVGLDGNCDYSQQIDLPATPERVARYLEVSGGDSDWWTSSTDPDFLYITTGERVTFAQSCL